MAEINKADAQGAFANYLEAIQKTLSVGYSSEGSHYPALKTLLEAIGDHIIATVLPAQIECGNPDFAVSKRQIRIGYVEAKDINESLDKVEKSEQLKRYRSSLGNLILTDFLEFRWYVDGEQRLKARAGTLSDDAKLKADSEGIAKTNELLNGFLTHQAEPVNSPKELALRMARMAHMLRDLIQEAVKTEPEKGTLHSQLSAFRENLIPDLDEAKFADMYAQTIAYGLFAARCQTEKGKTFTRFDAAQNLPKTNPFLRKLFQHIAGYDLDERIVWLVDDIAQLLAQADMEAVLKDFGKRVGKEDPVVHFYETFLAAYDPALRKTRGVYYTPVQVVSFIVRSIDLILKSRFNKPSGLADENVYILDPAVGTATFLYMVISEIHQHMANSGQHGMWDGYVTHKLLPRLFGFELLMAPYAVAHLKLGLQLQETEYQFKQDQRLGIYLTNTLDEAVKHAETLFAGWITEESNAAAEIKRDRPIMIVLGNPPYSGNSANKGAWAKKLIQRYKFVDGKPLGERNPKWLLDDYVKFIAFGQWRIERTGQGVLGFITNHSYLDNPTFRGMRQSLMNTFSDIYILNLHGNVKKREVAPDGGKDENVFDIQQGVAISLFVKEKEKSGAAKVHYGDLWGIRESKYKALAETDIHSTGWQELKPLTPFYLFIPQDSDLLSEYEQGWKLTDIFHFVGEGFTSHRDNFAVAFTGSEINQRLADFIGTEKTDEEIRNKYDIEDTGTWSLFTARKTVKNISNLADIAKICLYRPFDVRYCVLHESIMDRPRMQTQRQILKPNISLITVRNVEISSGFSHVFCSSMCSDRHAVSIKEINYVLPLYFYSKENEFKLEAERQPNLNTNFIKEFSDKLKLQFIPDGKGDLEENFGPEDIFNYAYAVFHSPIYRSRYAEFLRMDFPRLPLTSNKELFHKLGEKGAELVAFHLMESPALENLITKYPLKGSNIVEKVVYDEKSQRVYINKDQHFEGVPSEVWNFQVGGYQVCYKWLKDRKGRELSYDERMHYQKIVVALKETIRLMAEIDQIIPSWPIE